MYQALYRKYRPKDFDSVVGQDAIIKTLKNSIIHQNFSHAYMFFGPRGIGKTSISKIFARNINCLNPKEGIACGECENCKNSFSKDCIDILEIDAASNNGVNEIRELRSKITLVPSELKYKVYIIDEVHMLSDEAFNALLKTLEEPPEHAIFILATTDPQKVPETVVSRCQCFSFKRLSIDTIEKRLKYVCENEKISVDDEVLREIAIYSEGGMRDALGLLDKLSSFSSNKITLSDFTEINGIVSNEEIKLFLNNIMNAKISDVLGSIAQFDSNGKNLVQISIQLLNYCRNLLVNYYLNNELVDFPINLLHNFTNFLVEKMFDIKKSGNVRIYLELFILKFINDYVSIEKGNSKNSLNNTQEAIIDKSSDNFEKEKNNDNVTPVEDDEFDFDKEFSDDSEDELSDDISSIHVSPDSRELKSSNDFPKILNIDEINNVRINNTFALADKNLLNKEISNMELLKDYTFDQKIGYIVCSLLDSKIRVVSPDNMIISFEYESTVEQNLSIINKVMDVYSKITHSVKNIAIISDDRWEKLKKEYISNLKNNIKYEVMSEPEVIFEQFEKNDIISNSAVDLFGDIVEIE